MAKPKPKHDTKTRKFLTMWGRREVPTAQVAADPIKIGDYQAFAAVGWVENQGGTVIVGLQMAVLKEEPLMNMGLLTLGMPLTDKTESYVVDLLCQLGWDGRIWPYKDHGWPEGTDNELQIVQLCKQTELGCTMTFVSDDEKGMPMIPIRIAKNREQFALAPFDLEPTEHPEYLEALRALVADPSPFRADPSEDDG